MRGQEEDAGGVGRSLVGKKERGRSLGWRAVRVSKTIIILLVFK